MAEKTIDIASPILSRNERLADQLRQRFNETNTYVINVLSSPGSGKTTTILGTNERLRDKAGLRCAVIEGDIASDVDAITMKEAGMPAIQINTGGLCHLEGNMIMEAVDALTRLSVWKTSTSSLSKTWATWSARSTLTWVRTCPS